MKLKYYLKNYIAKLFFLFYVSFSVFYFQPVSFALEQTCLAPPSGLSNSFLLLNHEILNRNYSFYGDFTKIELNEKGKEIAELVRKHDGKVEIIPIFYKNRHEKEDFPVQNNSIFTIDEEKRMELLKKRIEDTENLLCIFFVHDQANQNFSRATLWLQKNFKGKRFLLVPCVDDFYKNPVIETQGEKYAQWYEWIQVLSLLGVKKTFYTGEKAVRQIFPKSEKRGSFSSHFSESDLALIYEALDKSQEEAIIETIKASSFEEKSHYLKCLTSRRTLSKNLIRQIILLNDYNALTALILNPFISKKAILGILSKECANLKGKVLETVISSVDKEDEKTAKALFFIYCANVQVINASIEKEYSKVNPLNVMDRWDPQKKSAYIRYLLENSFTDWEILFHNPERYTDDLWHFANEHGFLAAKILSHLFRTDTKLSLEIWDVFSHKHGVTDSFSKNLLYSIIQMNPELNSLTEVIGKEYVPGKIAGQIVIHALHHNRFETQTEYIEGIKEVFFDYDFKENFLNNPWNEFSSLGHWCKIVVVFPSIFQLMKKEYGHFPKIHTNPQEYITMEKHHAYLEKYNEFLLTIKVNDYLKEYLVDAKHLNHLIEVLNSCLVLPVHDKVSIFEGKDPKKTFGGIEDALNHEKINEGKSILELETFKKTYPHLPLTVLIPLLKVNDDELFFIVERIFRLKEINTYFIHQLKIASFLANKNMIKYLEETKTLLKPFLLSKNGSLKNQKRLLKVIAWFSLFLNLPEEKQIHEKLLESLTNLIAVFHEGEHKVTYARFMEDGLMRLFLQVMKENWSLDLELRDDLDNELLYERLQDVRNYWVYFSQWQDDLVRGWDVEETTKMIRVLTTAVCQYLNYGLDIKNFKYSGFFQSHSFSNLSSQFLEDTKNSRKQMEVMKALLQESVGDEQLVDFYLQNHMEDIRDTVVLGDGTVLYAHHTDSIVEALNRGEAGGGNCEGPMNSTSFTKCVNGTTFSPATKGILISTTPFGNEGIVYQLNSITNVKGALVPVLVTEGIYLPGFMPQGFSKKKFMDAAMVNSLRNAARYGYNYLFYTTTMTNHNIGCKGISVPDTGLEIAFEYMDIDGNIVQEKITVEEIIAPKYKGDDQVFYMLEEDNAWKYADNAIYHIREDGERGEKFHGELSSVVEFESHAYETEIAGIKCRTARNSMEGKLIRISREVVSKTKINFDDRVRQMYPELSQIEITELINELRSFMGQKLLVVSEQNLLREQEEKIETTLTLIDQITNFNMATDQYLGIVYQIAGRLGEFIWRDFEDLRDQKKRKIVASIPRGGIPISSGIRKVFSRKEVPHISTMADESRKLGNLTIFQDNDTVFLCDQVINTGKTLTKTMEWLLKSTGKNLRFVLVALAADPNALLKIFRHESLKDHIQMVYVADIRKRVEEKKRITSVIGHPGERSFSRKFENLYRIGEKIPLGNRVYTLEEPLGARSSRSCFVIDEAGRRYQLKIMVERNKGTRSENISILAREENFSGGILKGVEFFPHEGILLLPFIPGQNMSQYLDNFLLEKEDLERAICNFLEDILETLMFLKSQEHLSVNIFPVNVIFHSLEKRWYVTNFYSDQANGERISEEDALMQIKQVLDYLWDRMKQKGIPDFYSVRIIRSRINNGKIQSFNALYSILQEIKTSSPENSSIEIAA